MIGFVPLSVEEGIEIRIVGRTMEEVDFVGERLVEFVRECFNLCEFFDSGTILSTHPRYRGSYLRRIRLKLRR